MRIRQWGCPIHIHKHETLPVHHRAMGMPHFHGENPAEFCVQYPMTHRQGFMFVYMVHIDMLAPWRAKAPQSVKRVDACCIHEKTNITWWHRSRQSHHDDRAHNMAWICTYDNRLKHIPILLGQELLWLEKVTDVDTKVHHTKCIITHTHAGIYIYTYIHHAQHYHTERESKSDIANVLRAWPNKVQEM